jgi:hypothetical protein
MKQHDRQIGKLATGHKASASLPNCLMAGPIPTEVVTDGAAENLGAVPTQAGADSNVPIPPVPMKTVVTTGAPIRPDESQPVTQRYSYMPLPQML